MMATELGEAAPIMQRAAGGADGLVAEGTDERIADR